MPAGMILRRPVPGPPTGSEGVVVRGAPGPCKDVASVGPREVDAGGGMPEVLPEDVVEPGGRAGLREAPVLVLVLVRGAPAPTPAGLTVGREFDLLFIATKADEGGGGG